MLKILRGRKVGGSTNEETPTAWLSLVALSQESIYIAPYLNVCQKDIKTSLTLIFE